MKQLKNYNDLKLELEMAKERKNIISIYIKKLMYEEEQINNIIKEQNNTLNKIENNLLNLTGIEYKLFSEIVINKMNVSKAIEKIAEQEDKDVSTIWKNYYPKVKDKINEMLDSK
jgi:hypothetical protein|nr:MAG TPA: hypothetical protein [Caudoviricetes sp.]